MRYRKNPYEGLREHDIEHRDLLTRLRAAADTLKSFNTFDPKDPKFQALDPSAAMDWPNRELREAVRAAEADVAFYADFFPKKNPRKRRNPEERHFSSRRLSEVLTQLRYAEKDAGAAEKIAVQSNNRADFDKYNKQRIQARQWISFLERLIKRSSPSGAWEATYEFSSRPLPLGASHGERMQRAREIQRAAGQAIAKTISQKRRLV